MLVRLGRADQNGFRRHERVNGLQATRTHCLARFNKVDNAISEAQGACGFHTAAERVDRRLELAVLAQDARLPFEIAEELASEVLEARGHILADQVLDRLDLVTHLRDLHLQTALAKAERHHFGDAHRHVRPRLTHHILTGNTKVHITVGHKARDISCWKEHERDRQVGHKRHIQTMRTLELNICTIQQRNARLIKASLLRNGQQEAVL